MFPKVPLNMVAIIWLLVGQCLSSAEVVTNSKSSRGLFVYTVVCNSMIIYEKTSMIVYCNIVKIIMSDLSHWYWPKLNNYSCIVSDSETGLHGWTW